MKPLVLPAIGILILALLVSGCSTQGGAPPVTPTTIPTTITTVPTTIPTTTVAPPPPSPVGSWKLKALTVVGSGGSSGVQYASGNITAIFGPLGRVQGSGGCNQYSADYTTNGSSIQITNIASTLMSCGNVLDTQERAYFMILGEASTFETDGATLTIRTASSPPEKLAFDAA